MTETRSPSSYVSVIVPVYNDPEGVETTLKSLIKNRHSNFRIIPVNNNSTDRTEEIITDIASKNPDVVQPCQEMDIQSSYAARNTGIKKASGDILLFLDADMWVDETWIEEMVINLKAGEYDYLGCSVEVTTDENPTFSERYERAFSFPVESYLEHKRFAPTCALAVRRDVFDEVGLFDHHLESGGDKEFGQRVHRAGFDQGYTDSVTAYHPARNTLDELRSKACRIGRGRAQMRHYHPETSDYAHPLHPVRFLPPSPWRLRRRFSDGPPPMPDLLSFYALEYGMKLTQTVSSVREAVSLRRRK